MTPAQSGLAWVVTVEDRRNPQLTGRSGSLYESPPHDRAHALALVSLLLETDTVEGPGPWRRALAGGERVVALAETDTLF